MKVKKFFIGFFLKILFGILLVWLSASIALVLGPVYLHLPWLSRDTLVFGLSFIAYFLIHFMLYQPILSHVMAHELTHALAAVLMGGKVTSIHASTTGGTTVVNRSHVFISLAPYVFPLYTAVALGLWLIAAYPFKIYILALIGFTYGFHIALTIYSLTHHQPDLQEGGVVFSLIFIFAGNMIVLMLLTSFVWPELLPLRHAFSEVFQRAWHIALSAYHWVKPHFFHPRGNPA